MLPPAPTDERLSFAVDQFTGSGHRDYNANRPHSAHGELTPAEFALQWTTTHQPQLA